MHWDKYVAAYLTQGQQVVLPEKGVKASCQVHRAGRGGQRSAGSVCLLSCFPSCLPLPLQRAFKGGGSQEGRSAQWLLCGRSCLYSCQADGEELTLPTAAPPPSLLAAGRAHTLTRSAPLEHGQAVQLPAGCCRHSPEAVSAPGTGLPGSRVTDPNGATSLRSRGGKLTKVEEEPPCPTHPTSASIGGWEPCVVQAANSRSQGDTEVWRLCASRSPSILGEQT